MQGVGTQFDCALYLAPSHPTHLQPHVHDERGVALSPRTAQLPCKKLLPSPSPPTCSPMYTMSVVWLSAPAPPSCPARSCSPPSRLCPVRKRALVATPRCVMGMPSSAQMPEKGRGVWEERVRGVRGVIREAALHYCVVPCPALHKCQEEGARRVEGGTSSKIRPSPLTCAAVMPPPPHLPCPSCPSAPLPAAAVMPGTQCTLIPLD